MVLARLTTFSKLLITIMIVGAIVFGFNYLTRQGLIGKGRIKPAAEGGLVQNPRGDDETIRVGVVTWGGYAGGQYFNEGFRASEQSRFSKEYGIDVEFVVNDDVDASLNAWKNGDIDIHWYTIDAFPTILPGLKDFDPIVLWQADWSRGGDAIVARRGINSVADLRGRKVAVAELTPSHSFLIWLLDAGGLSTDDIEIVPQASAVDAAAAFKSGQVDAAVVWSPDDEQSVRAVPGSRVLESTRSASNIIADIFFAKREFAEANRDKLQKLYEGWMRGAAEINRSEEARAKAAAILADGLGIPVADAEQAISNVRLVTHGDNLNFFELNTEFRGVTGSALYRRMGNEYRELGYLQEKLPTFRQVSFPGLVSQTRLEGGENASEQAPAFEQVSQDEGEEKEAIATKRVSISFRTGEYQLDENARLIIDNQFVDIARAFGKARIRIEGNTDNTGSRATNVRLSRQRAQAVADYLVNEYQMPPDRFIIVGNGPDQPVADNSTAQGRSRNRRTDFELVRD